MLLPHVWRATCVYTSRGASAKCTSELGSTCELVAAQFDELLCQALNSGQGLGALQRRLAETQAAKEAATKEAAQVRGVYCSRQCMCHVHACRHVNPFLAVAATSLEHGN